MIPKFFKHDEYFIDEKVAFLKFANEYKVFNNKGEQIGAVKQYVSGFHKVLRLLINKAMMPFELNIIDSEEKILVKIKRGWTLLMSKIQLTDGEGNMIGSLKQKFKLFKPTFEIFNAAGEKIGIITGDWRAWNFVIKDMNENEIGVINKKWAGVAKELFTSADKYYVKINEEYAENEDKVNILATAITIDMVLKETK